MGVIQADTDGALCQSGPVLGGLECGQQVPGVLSVCIIIHFLHEIIYLDTRGQRHKRAVSSSVITHLSIGEGFDAVEICRDSAFLTPKMMKMVVTGGGGCYTLSNSTSSSGATVSHLQGCDE